MSDDNIIDTIAEPLREYASQWRYHLPGYGDDPDAAYVLDTVDEDAAKIAARQIAALRAAGYVITKPQPFVVTEEMLTDRPPNVVQQIHNWHLQAALAASLKHPDDAAEGGK